MKRRVSRTIFAVVSGLCTVAIAVVLVIWSPWNSDDGGGGDDIPAPSPSPTASVTDSGLVNADKINHSILIMLERDDDDSEITYDKDGYIIKITDEWEVYEFEYDFDAQTIKMSIDDDDRFGDEYDDIYVLLEYDTNGYIVSETEYHDGVKVWRGEYQYDDEGNVTWERTIYYNEDGSVDEQYETHYDADGNIVW